jgi:hypothetical protein
MHAHGLDLSHLSDAKRALLEKRLKGRSDIAARRGAPPPTELMIDPALRYEPFPVRSFVAERLRYRRVGSNDFRMFIETRRSGLDPERLGAAWQTLHRHCDVMRSRVQDGNLIVSAPGSDADILVRDVRGLASDVQQQVLAETRQRFEALAHGAEARAVELELIQTGEQELTCFYSFDLLVLDLPSIEFLALRCRRVYEDCYRPKRAFHVQDYRHTEQAWLDSEDGLNARRYWERRIAQSGPRLSARHLRAGVAETDGYGYQCHTLPREVWEQGQARARALGLSELVAVQVLFSDFLAFLSGISCFAYETRSFQRLPFDPDIYELLGQFTLGHLTGRDPGAPLRFADRVTAEAERMDRDAAFAFFDAASLWQADEQDAKRGAKIVFTNTCNRFAEFVQAGNVPPMRWFGDYHAIRQSTPDTALEYVLVENAGELENHWFVNHAHLPAGWVQDNFRLYYDGLFRLCTEDRAWELPSLFADATVVRQG